MPFTRRPTSTTCSRCQTISCASFGNRAWTPIKTAFASWWAMRSERRRRETTARILRLVLVGAVSTVAPLALGKPMPGLPPAPPTAPAPAPAPAPEPPMAQTDEEAVDAAQPKEDTGVPVYQRRDPENP